MKENEKTEKLVETVEPKKLELKVKSLKSVRLRTNVKGGLIFTWTDTCNGGVLGAGSRLC